MSVSWYSHDKQYDSKMICNLFDTIDSFEMFKYKEGLNCVMRSKSRYYFSVFRNNVTAKLMDDYSISISYDNGSYVIPVEKKIPNYGGFYYFFHCPQCDKRMRKLYLLEGKYLCRKCANLTYYTQKLKPSDRFLFMSGKIKQKMHKGGGSFDRKLPWQKTHTFKKNRKKYIEYDEKWFNALQEEALHKSRGMRFAKIPYFLAMPSGFYDVYDCKDDLSCY